MSYDDHFWEPFVPWLPHLPDGAWFALLWVGAAAAVLMTIGLWTRVATTAAFAVVATNLLLSQTHFRHNRAFLAILLAGLALLATGRVLSVDAGCGAGGGGSAARDPAVAMWLLRVQVTLVYLAWDQQVVDPDWFGGLVMWDRVVRAVRTRTHAAAEMGDRAADLRWLYYAVGRATVAHRAVNRCRAVVPAHPPRRSLGGHAST